VLTASRDRVLARLQQLARELESAQSPLAALRDRITTLRREIDELEVTEPGSGLLAARQHRLLALDQQWEADTERMRRYLASHDQLRVEGVRILTAMGRSELDIRQWDPLGAAVRTRLARLAIAAPP
jgi:hypothetical protein